MHSLLNLLFDIPTTFIGYHINAVLVRIVHSPAGLILTRLGHAAFTSTLPELRIDHIQAVQLKYNHQGVFAWNIIRFSLPQQNI